MLNSCFGCGNSVHPSCRVYSADLVRHFVRHGWTCDDCKTCLVCGEAQKNEDLIICEYCDLGVHYSCLDPRPDKRPKVINANERNSAFLDHIVLLGVPSGSGIQLTSNKKFRII